MPLVGGRICGDQSSELWAVLLTGGYVEYGVVTKRERVFHVLIGAGENGGEGWREKTLLA